MPPSEKNLNQITSITSATSFRQVEDHQIDIAAVTSKQISIGEVGVNLTTEQKHLILKRLHFDVLDTLDDLPLDATFMIEKVENLQVEEALEILKQNYEEFEDDFNYPAEDLDLILRLINQAPGQLDDTVKTKLGEQLEGKDMEKVSTTSIDVHSREDGPLEANKSAYLEIVDWDLQVRLEAAIVAYHSPYPEVRSVTLPYDDPNTPAETFRAYVIGVIWLAIGAFINQFFTERQPSITMSTAVAQLFLYPSGYLWNMIFPDVTVPLGKFSFKLNPGPWTYKEQMFATIIYSVAASTQYISYNIYSQKVDVFYGNTWVTWGYQILLSLSTNFLGFGFAGILRRFACYPIKAIWPSLLPTLALNQALLNPSKKENINGWTVSRYYFFFTTFGASFLWFWIPDYLFGALSYFNWMTWIKPDNFNLAMITGSYKGLGLNPITTFDWNIISFNYPLIYPWYTQLNNYLGTLLALPVICAIYWTNSKWTSYLPMNSNKLFNNVGGSYTVASVLNDKGLLDQAKYEEYGPPFYSAGNLVVYGAFFAIYPFSVFYESAIRWKEIKTSFHDIVKTLKDFRKPVLEQFHDPHSKMMSRYPEVPEWCFLIILVISIVLAILCVELYPTETPVWAIFFAVAINFVFLIPLTYLISSTGWGFGLNVLVELIIGYALPGNSQALMIIKAFGYNIDGQAQNYISDQKMAHYAKIPPRALFRGQLLAVFIGSFIGLGVMNWQFDTIVDICHSDQSQKFTCPSSTTFFSASVFWGTIGPKKVFGGLYPVLQYCFLIGFLLVFPALAFKWYGPKKWTRYFQPSIFMGGFLNYAPYNLSYYTPGLYVSFAFMYYIKKHYLTWWEKYNFVLSGGLDAGVAFSSIIIFFAVQYHDKSISWWGNDVSWVGVDGGYYNQTILDASVSAPDGYFGPRIGNFP
ncbi:oligopeptide transporter 2 [[Candida] railenensis]|uniref:Oligopeptide transporter 2 n=1 Tax=[Candida] railenensis TaxID=45579 RepID=A0A9P0QP78_9ASCO|nr:oligopeptide transporter 2 [[Candida] railenensis]